MSMSRRRTIRRAALLAATCVTLAAAAPAGATPMLTVPGAGANLTTSHPTFQWTLDPGQDSIAIRIADKPDLDTEGRLSSTVQSYFPDAAEGESLVSYTPARTSGLPAGTYYWQLQVYDFDQPYLSPVQSFTVAKKTLFASMTGFGTQKSQKIIFRPRINVNAQYVNVRTELWQGRRRIGKPSTSRWYNGDTIGVLRTVPMQYSPIGFKFRRGQTYKVKMRISANNIARWRTLNVRIR